MGLVAVEGHNHLEAVPVIPVAVHTVTVAGTKEVDPAAAGDKVPASEERNLVELHTEVNNLGIQSMVHMVRNWDRQLERCRVAEVVEQHYTGRVVDYMRPR